MSGLPTVSLLAQNEDAETLADLEACAAIDRGNARLACYDGVLGRPVSAQESATPAATDAPAAETAALAPAAVTGTVVAASDAAAATPGAAPNAAPPRQAIVVTELRLRTPSSAVFVTENGQVWEQTGSGRGRYPEVPFEATIEDGSLGSKFLISPAGGPRIRVTLRE